MRLGLCLSTGFTLVFSFFFVLVSPQHESRWPGQPSVAVEAPDVSRSSAPTARDAVAKLPPLFVSNAGQTDPRVRYVAQGAGYTFAFMPDAVKFVFMKASQGAAFDLRFVNANPNADLEARRQTSGKVNYFIGNDPARWRTGLSTYEELVYRELWPGIDLAFRGMGGQLKYEFLVRPGASVEDIRLAYRGAEALSLDTDGSLRITTALGALTDRAPVSYQEIEGKRVHVESRFVLDGGVAFAVGAYAADRPLVIDPGLLYSTLLGGMSVDQGRGVAVDGSGSAVVTGLTASTPFPVSPGAFDSSLGDGQDAFVTKLNPAGSGLVFSTYLGGTTAGGAPGTDGGFAVALDGSGNVFVTGITSSTDFPNLGGFDTSYNGSGDAFVTKFSSTGVLLASTYLGSPGNDQGFGIVVDASGSPIVTGVTPATGFPTTVGAYDTGFNGLNDAFVTKLAPTLSTLVYSTYLGGTAADIGESVSLDTAGMAIVTGFTASAGGGSAVAFPTTSGAYQTVYGGGLNDAFVTKLNLTGTGLVFSTFLGGTGNDQAYGIAVDAAGSPTAAGYTSGGFPTTLGAFQTTYGSGSFDAFVTKLDSAGASLAYSTYLGGTSTDQAFGVALDAMGRPTVTGTTSSASFPTTCGAFDTTYNGNGDVFVSRLDASGASLVYSSFLGGTPTGGPASVDNGFAIAIDAAASAYVTGSTFPLNPASTFPTTPLAFDTSANGSFDAFVTKFDMIAAATLVLSPATDSNPVGTLHTVTATLTSVGGGPCPGVTVYFSVPTSVMTHAVPSNGSDVTDANGLAEFTYSAALPGTDVIQAFADLNGDGDQDSPPEPFDEATKVWTLPPSTEFCEVTITNGGWIIADNGDRASFGGNAKVSNDGSTVQGQEEYQDHGPADPRNVKSTELLATTCTTDSDPQSATIFGKATIDGSGEYIFRIDVTDGGPGGSNDSYGIIMSDGYESGQQQLEGGNVNIHKP
jgi:hypothetical protein